MENITDIKLEEKVIAVKEVLATPIKKVAEKVVSKKPVVKVTTTKKVTAKATSVEKVAAKANTVSLVNGTSNEIKKVVSSTVKDITKKVDFAKNVDKVKTSVKSLNEKLVSSTTDIYNEVVEMNKEIAGIATKSVKEIANNFDIKVEIAKIKTTASELNEKAINRVKELNSQVLAKAEDLKSTTAKLANEMVENIRINERLATAKDIVVNSNKYALEATENAIDNVEKNATEWQKLSEKAVNKGFKLASKQQELVFDTLEEVKTQVKTTRNNFKKLFSSTEA
jgi:hypothetical protein